MSSPSIRLLLADVDGTLVTSEKILTEASIGAVRKMGDAGVQFAITSGRPPRGMSMLFESLDLQTPIAAFNGGLLVDRDMSVLEQRVIPSELIAPTIALLESFALSVWVYRGAEWCVRDLNGPHVDREQDTVQFAPTLVETFDDISGAVAKIVGVSEDFDAVARAGTAALAHFGDQLSATRSQPYYLDVTHPEANKGSVVRYLAAHYGIPTEAIATIGDGPNDVLMFANSGLSIAMGNASPEVQRAATGVTSSNDQEGFASAVEHFILANPASGQTPA